MYTSCYIGVDTPLDRHFNMILIVSGKKKESRNPDTFPMVTLVRCCDQQNFTTFVIFSKHQHEHSLNTLTLVRTFDKRQIICSMHELQEFTDDRKVVERKGFLHTFPEKKVKEEELYFT